MPWDSLGVVTREMARQLPPIVVVIIAAVMVLVLGLYYIHRKHK